MQAKRMLTAAVCLLAVGIGTARAADEMSVQVKTTQVRTKDSYLGTALYRLKFGDRVTVIERGPAWFKVRPAPTTQVMLESGAAPTPENTTGFINKSALSSKRIVLKADQSAEMSASADDVALAGKGFNDEVEQSYRNEHPNLSAAYASLDQIEADSAYSPTAEEINAFRAAGGLNGGAQ